jgi:hypothetical protein
VDSPLLQPAERPHGIPDPYLVYLDGLAAPESRRTMRAALDAVVGLVLEEHIGGAVYEAHGKVTGEGRPWWLLRAADTRHISDLIRSPRPAPPGAPAQVPSKGTVDKRLSALRGVLEKCWRLRLMTGDDYLWAVEELKTVPLSR